VDPASLAEETTRAARDVARPGLAIAAVGAAVRAGADGLRIPLLLRDASGQQHKVALVLRIEAEDPS
jgi:hypothetical protein